MEILSFDIEISDIFELKDPTLKTVKAYLFVTYFAL